ncbi:TPA: bacteriophage abortive infection AbiH family protein [Streptococcus suis]|nr:bacteriophage abortive infection AbiH family protein [Streptococcus suis]
MDKLFIIGNGFDIAHGLKSDYLYFKKYVYEKAYGENQILSSLDDSKQIEEFFLEKDEKIELELDSIELPTSINSEYSIDNNFYRYFYKILLDVSKIEEFWRDFEKSLVNIGGLFVETFPSSPEYAPHTAEDTAENIKEFVSYAIPKLLGEWISYVYQDWEKELEDRIIIKHISKDTIMLSKDAYFLTFNYTLVLEDYYGISSKQICHIHGELYKPELLMGHGDYYSKLHEDPTSTPYYLDGAVEATRKPVQKQLQRHAEFFDGLKDVKELYVIGFNLTDSHTVDRPYFETIFEKVPNIDIYIDSFAKDDEYKIKRTLNDWGAKKAYQLRFIDTDTNTVV